MLKVDTKLYRMATFIYKIMLLNVLLIIGSLGIVTAGAAISATFYIWRQIFKGVDNHIVKDFISNYKKNLKETSIITVLFLVIFALLSYRIESTILIYLNYFLKFHLVVTILFSLFIISKYDLDIKGLLIFSFATVNRNMYIILPFFLIPYLHMFLVKHVVFLFLATGPSITLLISTAIFYPILKKSEDSIRG